VVDGTAGRTRSRSATIFSTLASRTGYEARAWNQDARALWVVYRRRGGPSARLFRGPGLILISLELRETGDRFFAARLTIFFFATRLQYDCKSALSNDLDVLSMQVMIEYGRRRNELH
jgi:hypothetical protein